MKIMNLNEILADARSYNLHTHTQFCDGHAQMEEFVKAAIEHGITRLGFTPHSPLPFHTPCNMEKEKVEAYFAEVTRLRREYCGKIDIYAGMEVDFLDEWGPWSEYFAELPLDYKIGSVHFVPTPDGSGEYVDIDGKPERFTENMHKVFDDDVEWVVRKYYEQALKMIERGGFEIIGHLDKVGYNASVFRRGIDREPWYDTLVKREIEGVMDMGYIVEVNTKSWENHGRMFPDERYWDLLRRWGATLVINSDAHYPELINAGREYAMRELGL